MISDQLRSRADDLADIERDALRDNTRRLTDLLLVAAAIKNLADQVAELERNFVPAECRRLPDAETSVSLRDKHWAMEKPDHQKRSATISLAGELRWFLSCMDEDSDYFIPIEVAEPILAFWRQLGDMAEATDRRLYGASNQLTLAIRCIVTALRTLSETDDGQPREIQISQKELPSWRIAIGNAIALAAAAETDLGGCLVFFNSRQRENAVGAGTKREGVAP